MSSNSTAPLPTAKPVSPVALLKLELRQLEKARAKVQERIVEAAVRAEAAGRNLKKKKRPKKRKWKDGRPAVPRKDFPLSPHASGKWMKKIRGTIRYFGRWASVVNGKLERVKGDGIEEAERLYNVYITALQSGNDPKQKEHKVTLGELCGRFRTAKMRAMEAGEISQRMYSEWIETCDLLIGKFGKDRACDSLVAVDFESLLEDMRERWGPVRRGNVIGRVRSVFKYGADPDIRILDRLPPFGPSFKKPSAKVLRIHRAQNGEKMLEAADCKALLDAAGAPLKAMLLLGLNCGFGNHDLATLPESAVDLVSGWVSYHRPKTGIKRRAKLWPETVVAIREAIAQRPKCRQEGAESLLFLTARGRQWLSEGIAHPVAAAVIHLMKKCNVHRKGLGPYVLRHVHRTIADGARDQAACDMIMGHARIGMAGVYVERIDDSRLAAVADHVHAWLYPPKAAKGRKGGAA